LNRSCRYSASAAAPTSATETPPPPGTKRLQRVSDSMKLREGWQADFVDAAFHGDASGVATLPTIQRDDAGTVDAEFVLTVAGKRYSVSMNGCVPSGMPPSTKGFWSSEPRNSTRDGMETAARRRPVRDSPRAH
jgi:hypothetical protein